MIVLYLTIQSPIQSTTPYAGTIHLLSHTGYLLFCYGMTTTYIVGAIVDLLAKLIIRQIRQPPKEHRMDSWRGKACWIRTDGWTVANWVVDLVLWKHWVARMEKQKGCNWVDWMDWE